MKKIAFILAVLLFAAPALAQTTVTISAVQVPGTNQVEIGYLADPNLPRAFGLDITVDYGVITDCTPAMVGECSDLVRGFGIFPGTIVIDVDGNVTDDGTPVAPFDDPGALGGLGTTGITVEMGSLYVDGNEPPLEGVLCTITVTENCTVTIAGNAARCGTGSDPRGVVMVDWTEVPTVYYEPGVVTLGVCPGDVTTIDTGLRTGPPPDSIITFDSGLWEGPDGKTDTKDVQALIFLLAYDGTAFVVSPVPAVAAAGDVTATDTGLRTGPPPDSIITFDKSLWTGPDGKIDTKDVQALIFLLQYDGTAFVYTCP